MTPNRIREEITLLNEIAADYYYEELHAPRHTGPREYLAARGFGALLNDTRWTVGFAPAGWTNLHDHLAKAGHSDEAMLAAGLVSVSRRGTPIDLFRDRITFGIRDIAGRLVGFTARAAPASSDDTPKYLNTPRTPAYDKSSVLFGLHEARDNQTAGTTVVTEGPLDALAVDLAGRGRWAPVALCGTSFTATHAELIAELGRPALLALDDDPAGHRALAAATSALTPRLGEPQAPPILLGLDPADVYTRLGHDALDQVLGTPTPASDVVISQVLRRWSELAGSPDGSAHCLREAAHTLVQLRADDLARHAVRLTRELGLDQRTVTGELAAAVTDRLSQPHPERWGRLPSPPGRDRHREL